MFKSLATLSILFSLFFITPLHAQQFQESVVVVVNDFVITNLDINDKTSLIMKSSGMNIDKKTQSIIRNHAMYSLIDERLISSEAHRLGVEIDEKDLQFALNSIAQKNGVSLKQLESHTKKAGINFDDLQEQIKNQLLWNKIIRTTVEPKIFVSDKEVEENKKAIIAALHTAKNQSATQVKLAEIVIYGRGKKKAEDIDSLAWKLHSEIKAGANFNKFAREFSQSASAKFGGEIGWVYTSQLMPELVRAIAHVHNGDISKPIVTDDGVSLIKVIDRKDYQATLDPEQIDTDRLKEILFNKKLDLQIKSYLRKLRKEGYINFK